MKHTNGCCYIEIHAHMSRVKSCPRCKAYDAVTIELRIQIYVPVFRLEWRSGEGHDRVQISHAIRIYQTLWTLLCTSLAQHAPEGGNSTHVYMDTYIYIYICIYVGVYVIYRVYAYAYCVLVLPLVCVCSKAIAQVYQARSFCASR